MNLESRNPARLALEDGTVYEGWQYGARGTRCGETVFNTSMSGYTEILTDPSYKGQFVTFSYPQIGNYGVSDLDFESSSFQAEGVVVREGTHSAGQAPDLEPMLVESGVVGIQGIDTRSLVRRLRDRGVLKGCIDSTGIAASELVARARAHASITGGNFVEQVSTSAPYDFDLEGPQEGPRVAVMDYGVKRSILRCLARGGARVRVFPAKTSRADLLAWDPQGVVLSNGPGDPVDVPYAVELAKSLVGELPVLGICLGHQILGQAAGMKTFKLSFGHHAANHPVADVRTGAVWITSQNHNYCVQWDEAASKDWEITLRNLNDKTMEGFRHRTLPVTAIQFHPEAGPGPHDAFSIFPDFLAQVRAGRTGAAAR